MSSADNVRLAIFSVVFSVLALSFGDATIKLVSANFTLWQIYVLRSLLAVPALIAIAKFRSPEISLMPMSLGWTTLRNFLLVAMWAFYYLALTHVYLSVAAAVYYTIPLFITLFSALFTRDKVNWKSWVAIPFGFAGVLIIVRPTAAGFTLYALLPLASAILYACAMILTRTKCRDENPQVLSLWLNLLFVAVGVVASLGLLLWQPSELASENFFLFGNWTPMNAKLWLAIAVLACIFVIGNIFAALAYQRGPSAIVAQFDYTYLVFSLLWGWLLFSEVLDFPSLIGMAMIAAAGIGIARGKS